jgi:hypothetical protein
MPSAPLTRSPARFCASSSLGPFGGPSTPPGSGRSMTDSRGWADGRSGLRASGSGRALGIGSPEEGGVTAEGARAGIDSELGSRPRRVSEPSHFDRVASSSADHPAPRCDLSASPRRANEPSQRGRSSVSGSAQPAPLVRVSPRRASDPSQSGFSFEFVDSVAWSRRVSAFSSIHG